ncbi:hypothetical protein M2138_000979 [Dysgonomonadaceae bacterium PH5-43]|nr:hypothetical protein [Dysgonomonadaceae bacterium PH5-43]
MKKHSLYYVFLFCFFIFSFQSCVEDDYDFDDDKMDKNAVFSPGGVNFPVGSIERISILDELTKQLDSDIEIQVNNQGILYLEYEDKVFFDVPEYDIPYFDSHNSEITDIVLPSIPGLGGYIPIPQGAYDIVPETNTLYEIERPSLSDVDGLDVTLNSIHFDQYPLYVTLNLNGFIPKEGGDADVILSLTFPDNFVIASGENMISERVSVNDIYNGGGTYTIPYPVANITSYTYSDQPIELNYSVTLDVKSPTLEISAGGTPQFDLTFLIDNDNVKLNKLDCYAIGEEIVTGSFDDFGDINNSFDNAILSFANPSLLATVTTNLTGDFSLDLGLQANGNREASVSGLNFEKPEAAYPATKATQYYLAPQNKQNPSSTAEWREFSTNNLFKGAIPEEVAYNVVAKFDTDVTLYPDNSVVALDYLFTLPFEFEKIDLTISDIAEDVFDEDLYDDILKYAEEKLTIEADDVDIKVGDNVEIIISAVILDDYNNALITLDDIMRDNGTKIIMQIEGDDIEKMKRARHLKFVFQLKGKGTIKETDYIDIKGVKLISDGGIHFDF